MLDCWLLLSGLAGISGAMLLWGFAKPERTLAFPTLFGAAWLLYAIPQLTGILLSPEKIPEMALRDGGLTIGITMCILCAAAGWAGYAVGTRAFVGSELSAAPHSYSLKRLFIAGVVLSAVAFWGAWQLAKLSGGFVAQFSGGAHYSLLWEGEPVRYSFFAEFFLPALLLLLIVALQRPSILHWSCAVLAALHPLAAVLFLARRETAIALGAILVFSLFFCRHWIMPRWAFALLMLLAATFVFLAPDFREVSQFGLRLPELRRIEPQSRLRSVLTGQEFAEFEGLVVHAAAINQTRKFDYGASLYNVLISRTVPRQVVGEDFKKRLLLDTPYTTGDGEALYGWVFPTGSFHTGPLSAFRAFWYFGAGFYAILGFCAAFCWEAAYRKLDLFAQSFYTFYSVTVPMSVVASINGVLADLLTIGLPLALLFWWARSPAQVSSKRIRARKRRQGA